MPKLSAGLLMYRLVGGRIEVLLAHPGGPFWKNKDHGAWTIPKGEIEKDEVPLSAARREFEEETGIKPDGKFIELGEVKLKSGKRVRCWAFEGDCDPAQIRSNTFSLEWPPRSGKFVEVPEIDQAAFWSLEMAKVKINAAQVAFIERLKEMVA